MPGIQKEVPLHNGCYRSCKGNILILPHPALGIVAIGTKLRRGCGKLTAAGRTIKSRLTDQLVELVLIEGYLIPPQTAVLPLYPESIVQGQCMGHIQESFQIIASITFQQSLDVFTMLGSFTTFQKACQRLVTMKKLSNEKFVNKAPANVIEKERKKQADAESKIASLKESIAALKK